MILPASIFGQPATRISRYGDHVRICPIALEAPCPGLSSIGAQLAKRVSENLDHKDYRARNEHSQE
jgi:hypothetical protein